MAKRLYTAADLEDIEDDSHQIELDRGVLVRMNLPKLLHGLCCSNVNRLVGNFVRDHNLGVVICNDAGYWLESNPDTVRGPDVSFIRSERLEGLSLTEYPHWAPDLAVEVLTEDTRKARMQNKVKLYLEKGARLVWLVDPYRKRIKGYHADGRVQTLAPGDMSDGESVLPGFTCPVASIFTYR